MIKVGIGKIANSGFGKKARITTMLKIASGATNSPVNKRVLLGIEKGLNLAFVISIHFMR